MALLQFYFGTKPVAPNESISLKNASMQPNFIVNPPYPERYFILVIHLDSGLLIYFYNSDTTDPVWVKAEKYDKLGKYAVYYIKNTINRELRDRIITNSALMIKNENFTKKYKISEFGDVIEKFAFYIVPTTFNESKSISIPPQMPRDVKYIILSDPVLTIFDILELCQFYNDVCEVDFWKFMAKQRLSESYEFKNSNQVIDDLILTSDVSLHDVPSFMTKFPIAANKIIELGYGRN
jgi:hypothetical protein